MYKLSFRKYCMTNIIPHTQYSALALKGVALSFLTWSWDVFMALTLALYSVALLTSLVFSMFGVNGLERVKIVISRRLLKVEQKKIGAHYRSPSPPCTTHLIFTLPKIACESGPWCIVDAHLNTLLFAHKIAINTVL